MTQGDLFDNLPDPSTEHPTVGDTSAAPGSRRAAREAAARGQGLSPAASDAESSEPVASEASPVQSATVSAAASPQGGSLDDLFAPEAHTERPKPKRSRRKGCLIWLIILVLVFGGVAATGAWVMNTYGEKINDIFGWGEPKDYLDGEATGEVYVTIEEGFTGRPISQALHAAGVTKTDDVFYDMLIKEGLNPVFMPGVYKLQERMTAAAALTALEDPANKLENSVGIREGSTIASSLPTIADSLGIPLADLEAAVADPSQYGVAAERLEGWLFPAVYTFDPDVTAVEVITAMVERTRKSLAAAGVPASEEQRILTIASIIQREGRVADFDKVSRVIYNRLDDNMKLEMDSTAQYGYGELHAGTVSTSEAAQRDKNAWNTYEIQGLPVTPIASSSDAAIDAAMHPADGPWLFFVTINPKTGETIFSVTYEEHLKGVATWRAWCKENPGSC